MAQEEAFHKFEIWLVGSGSSIPAWSPNWIAPDLRLDSLGVAIPEEVRHWSVADLVDMRGCWKNDFLQTFLPDSVMCRIASILPMSCCVVCTLKCQAGTGSV